MASTPKQTVKVNELNSVDVFNAVRQSLGSDFQSVIPEAYKPKAGGVGSYENGLAVKSLYAIGEAFRVYPTHANNFLTALINRVAVTIITSRLYENPWKVFKRGILEMGETVEEIFVGMSKPFQFDPDVSQTRFAKIYKPDVQASYHPMNFQKFYPTSVSNMELRQAFTTLSGLTDLISRIIEQVYTGANYDEFIIMKYMIAREALSGEIASVTIPAVNASNAREVTSTMVTQAKNMSYMSSLYNRAGVKNYTDPKYLITILTTDISSIFDVEVLALSFNMEKAELLGNQIGVDGFGIVDNERLEMIFADDPYTNYVPFTDSELSQLQTISALMVDKDWFMVFDNLIDFNEFYNGEGLYYTYRYHVWKTFSTSPFQNAVLFTTAVNSVISVTISPASATVAKGNTIQLYADVATTGFASKSVQWSVSGTDTTTSAIDETGALYVNQNEANTTLTVTAVSLEDPSISGTATINVS